MVYAIPIHKNCVPCSWETIVGSATENAVYEMLESERMGPWEHRFRSGLTVSSALRKVATQRATKTAQNDGFFRSSRMVYIVGARMEGGLSSACREGGVAGRGGKKGDRERGLKEDIMGGEVAYKLEEKEDWLVSGKTMEWL